MKLTKRFWRIGLFTFIGIAFAGGIMYMTFPFTNPSWMTGAISLSRPKSAIRRDILRITPLGTNMEDVLRIIEEREWKFTYTSETNGYFVQDSRPEFFEINLIGNRDNVVVIGEKSIRTSIGKYNRFFVVGTYVQVFYAFDEDSNLVDVAIGKEMDLP